MKRRLVRSSTLATLVWQMCWRLMGTKASAASLLTSSSNLEQANLDSFTRAANHPAFQYCCRGIASPRAGWTRASQGYPSSGVSPVEFPAEIFIVHAEHVRFTTGLVAVVDCQNDLTPTRSRTAVLLDVGCCSYSVQVNILFKKVHRFKPSQTMQKNWNSSLSLEKYSGTRWLLV